MCHSSALCLPVSLLCSPCYLVSCLPPYFPITPLSCRIHLEHLAARGSLVPVPRRSLAPLVPFCKLCTPSTGWPRRSVLNSVSEKKKNIYTGGWGGCTFFLFLFGLRHLLSNYWLPCALNHATGLFSELVIHSLNHPDPPFSSSFWCIYKLATWAWDSKNYSVNWTSKMVRKFNSQWFSMCSLQK